MPLIKTLLADDEIPKAWYNILPDLPKPLPPVLNPATRVPILPEDLAPLFPDGLLAQEFSGERFVEIPRPVLDVYRLWRPTPLIRAKRWEEALKTPARIFYKWEGVSPPGSHKPNTAVPQAYYNKMERVRRITTETGAGQWGSALSFACSLFGIECKVYMVRVSYDQKPYRRIMMETWGGHCVSSPSLQTEAGRRILKKDPDSPGSLGIAISEAVEEAAKQEDTKYALGSVLNHVMLHQTIIGQEVEKQLKRLNIDPDILVGCCGGGSNFAGLVLPFVRDKILNRKEIRVIGVEPTACPTLTRGLYRYDFGDTACTTPLIKMYTLGHDFIPAPIHAGGLRYHGMSPLLCHLYELGYIEAKACSQNKAFEAAVHFARSEGFIPAPETAHAIRTVMELAVECREKREDKVIVFNASGHGHFDLASYEKFLHDELEDFEPSEKDLEISFQGIPG